MKLARGREVSVCVGPDGLHVFGPDEETAFRWPAPGADFEHRFAEELRSALDGIGRARVSVILLPPFVDVKRLELPPLRSREITAVLDNHASRYFPRRITRVATGWSPLKEGSGGDILAAAADEEPLTLLLDILQSEGHSVRDPVPAHMAWARAAMREGSVPAKVQVSVCIEMDCGWTILGLRAGRVVSSTTFPPESVPLVAERLRAVLNEGGSVVVVGEGTSIDGLADALCAGTPREPVRLAEDPVRLASRFAASCRGPTVLPRHLRERRVRSRRKAEGLRLVAAGLLLLIAVGLDTWRLSGDLTVIRARRAAHSAEVEQILGMQDRISELDTWFAETLEHAETAIPWSQWLARVVGALPAGTRLDQIIARPGELEIVGSGANSAAVLGAVEVLPGIVAVDVARPVRRVQGPAGLPEEQFALVVRIDGESLP